MASVQQETEAIRILLEARLPEIIAAIGAEAPELTAEQIATLLAGATAPLGVRAAPPAGAVAGLYAPSLEGDTAPALVAGAAGVDAPGIVVQTANNSLWADTSSQYEPAIAASATASLAIQASNNSTTTETIRAQNSGAGLGLVVNAGNSSVARLASILDGVARHAILQLLRGDSTNAIGTALSIEWHFQANAPDTLSGYDEMYISAANNTARRFWIRKAGTVQQAAAFDGSSDASQTGMLLDYNGTMVRVKVGAAGSGPGGSGRALYID